jgi:hypothetical protein
MTLDQVLDNLKHDRGEGRAGAGQERIGDPPAEAPTVPVGSDPPLPFVGVVAPSRRQRRQRDRERRRALSGSTVVSDFDHAPGDPRPNQDAFSSGPLVATDVQEWEALPLSNGGLRPGSASCEHVMRWRRTRNQAHPVSKCVRPSLHSCELCGHDELHSCGSASRAKCGPCSGRYRYRVKKKFESGFRDDLPATHHVYFVTATAPGDARHWDSVHGRWCPCTDDDGVDPATWHENVPRAWSDSVGEVRRHVAADVDYMKIVELQEKRLRRTGKALLHVHAWMRSEVDLTAKVEELRSILVRHGFGHEVKVERVHHGGGAGYLAKYCSESVDAVPELEWADSKTGEVHHGEMHMRVTTASRGYGLSMVQIKTAGQAIARERAAGLSDPGVTTARSTSTPASLLVTASVVSPTSDRSAQLLDLQGTSSTTPNGKVKASPM